jgi:hypothetical protein
MKLSELSDLQDGGECRFHHAELSFVKIVSFDFVSETLNLNILLHFVLLAV